MNLQPRDIAILLISMFVFLSALFYFILHLAMRYRRKKVETDKMRELFASQLASSRIEMQEQTLQYVSRELHDNIGQVASLLKIYLGTVKYDDEPKLRAKIEDSKNLVQNLVTDIKLLSTTLNTDKLVKMNLPDAVKIEGEKIDRTGEFKVIVSVEGEHIVMDNDKKLILFRMIQEILNNTVKHSGANYIDIKFTYLENNLILEITDNGHGFNVEEKLADNQSGNGLINLQNRAHAIKGNLQISSIPGIGTTHKLIVPI